MTDVQAQTVIALLAVLVEDVRAMREMMTAALSAPDQEDSLMAGCPHPDEKRVDLSTPNDRDHWVCGVCRFDNKSTA